MANLAEKREPRAWSPRAVWAAIDELRDAVKYLRSSQNVVGRATVSGGRDLIIDDGGGIRVRRGGNVAAEYPSGPDAALWGRLYRDLNGDLVYGMSAMAHDGHTYFWAYHYDDPADNGHVQCFAEDVFLEGRSKFVGGVADDEFGGGASRFFEASEDLVIMQWTAPAGTFPNFVKADSDGITLQAVTGAIKVPGMATTGAAANLNVNFSTAEVKASVSSRRYKDDIEDLEVDVETVLKLVPRKFRMKADIEELGDAAPVYVGFIAEEAHDLGLTQWVAYANGQPEAFDYPTFCVAQQAALVQLRDRVAALEDKVNGGSE